MHLVVGKLLMGLMLMSIAFLLSLSGSGCTVHDLGFSAMAFLGHALQKTEALGGCCCVAEGAWQHWSSMCRMSPAVLIGLHLTFPNPVMLIALLIPFTLQICMFLIGVMKSFLSLVMHADAPESQIVLHASV